MAKSKKEYLMRALVFKGKKFLYSLELFFRDKKKMKGMIDAIKKDSKENKLKLKIDFYELKKMKAKDLK